MKQTKKTDTQVISSNKKKQNKYSFPIKLEIKYQTKQRNHVSKTVTFFPIKKIKLQLHKNALIEHVFFNKIIINCIYLKSEQLKNNIKKTNTEKKATIILM